MSLISTEMEKLIEEGVALLPPSSKTRNPFDIEQKAARFLVLKAHVADSIWELERLALESASLEKADYVRAMDEVDVKTIAEKQVRAAADPDYLEKKKQLGEVKVALDWLNTYLDIFSNAHIFYRQQMRQDQGV